MTPKRKRPTQGGAFQGFDCVSRTVKANSNHSEENQVMNKVYNSTVSLSPLTSHKEVRAIAALLDNTAGVPRIEMDNITNTTNSPQYIAKLRCRGLVIITELYNVETRDGVSRVGRYVLHPESRPLAVELLNLYDKETVQTQETQQKQPSASQKKGRTGVLGGAE